MKNLFLILLAIVSTQTFAASSALNFGSLKISGRGLSGSDETAYTPTIVGAGTVSSQAFTQRRSGDQLYVTGWFVAGTPTATPATISLPSGLTIDATKIVTSRLIGSWQNDQGTTDPTENKMYALPSGTTVSFRSRGSLGTIAAGDQNGSTIFGSGHKIYIEFNVPIQGWNAGGDANAPKNTLRVYNKGGHGSTNTKVSYFASEITTNYNASDFTYVNNSTSGFIVTIVTAGVYSFSASQDDGAGGADFGFSLNSNQLTTNIFSITNTDRLIMETSGGSNVSGSTTWIGYLPAGSVVAAHDDGAALGGASAKATVTVTKISN